MNRCHRAHEAGFSLVQVIAATSVMLILMTAGVPAWRYVMKDAREEELIFRGGQIADAVWRFQKKNGNALPTSIEMLVKGKFLRKAYKDPMTADGKWRLIRVGDASGGVRPPQLGETPRGPLSSPSPRSDKKEEGETDGPAPSGGGTSETGGGGGATMGPFRGVASMSKESSLRVFNGKTKYNEWQFIPCEQRVVGLFPVRQGIPCPQAQASPPGPQSSPTPTPNPNQN